MEPGKNGPLVEEWDICPLVRDHGFNYIEIECRYSMVVAYVAEEALFMCTTCEAGFV